MLRIGLRRGPLSSLRTGGRCLSGGGSRRVLVLGGSGFVGERVCLSLLRLGARPEALSRAGRGRLPQVRYLAGDLLSDDWHGHVCSPRPPPFAHRIAA